MTNGLIIAGPRDYFNASHIFSVLDLYCLDLIRREDIEVFCGEATGVDAIGKEWAMSKGLSVRSFPADWDKHGKYAGPYRNEQMAKEATYLITFSYPQGSKGTNNMIANGVKYGLKCRNIIIST